MVFGVALDLFFLVTGVDGASTESAGGWTVDGSVSVAAAALSSDTTRGSATVEGVSTDMVVDWAGASSTAKDNVLPDGPGVPDSVDIEDRPLALLLLGFFFSPVIDDDTVFDSFGFCFKS